MSNGNNKITLAVINTKLEYISRDISSIKAVQGGFLKRLERSEKSITRLKERQSLWNYGLAILGAIAGALGLFKHR